ncbi:DUF2304 domain-containing protein [Arsenicicoccus sp. oral taxon 190]|uniref:DUF2304 domain-containing protein n=1 Tax=Arsenicicoccus sp. oral taxon 190 TaxID=1658671 RepID=UPI0009E1C64A|nr:DUF2304 domain-containing protein [Arsenicicoccus sp. oral taxon 190]
MKALIQLALSLAVLVVVLRLVTARGARTQAIRRLGLMAFAAFAVFSILYPRVWTWVARQVGVGRGTDLVLYVLVIGFLGYMVSTQLRFRELEVRLTRLSRRIALDEALQRHPEVASGGSRQPDATVMRPEDDPDDADPEAAR